MPQRGEGFEVLDDGDLILHEVEVFELGEVRETLDVLDLVEGEVEGGECGEGLETFDVGDKVVVEVDFGEGCSSAGGDVDGFEAVLAEAEALVVLVGYGQDEFGDQLPSFA